MVFRKELRIIRLELVPAFRIGLRLLVRSRSGPNDLSQQVDKKKKLAPAEIIKISKET